MRTLSREFFLVAIWSGDPMISVAFFGSSKFLISIEIRERLKEDFDYQVEAAFWYEHERSSYSHH